MAKTKTSQQTRQPKFYDDILNTRLRELLDSPSTRTEDFAHAVGISSSAVRMWYNGYSRPDIEKIPEICKFFEVSAEWLLGMSASQSTDMDIRKICDMTGLSDEAVCNLIESNDSLGNESPQISNDAKTHLWLAHFLLQDKEFFGRLAQLANDYVNINVAEEFESPTDGATMEIMRKGIDAFGMTFNFTVGHETADFLEYQCQQQFLEFLRAIPVPAVKYVANRGDNDA